MNQWRDGQALESLLEEAVYADRAHDRGDDGSSGQRERPVAMVMSESGCVHSEVVGSRGESESRVGGISRKQRRSQGRGHWGEGSLFLLVFLVFLLTLPCAQLFFPVPIFCPSTYTSCFFTQSVTFPFHSSILPSISLSIRPFSLDLSPLHR